jgi:hypothetical protein
MTDLKGLTVSTLAILGVLLSTRPYSEPQVFSVTCNIRRTSQRQTTRMFLFRMQSLAWIRCAGPAIYMAGYMKLQYHSTTPHENFRLRVQSSSRLESSSLPVVARYILHTHLTGSSSDRQTQVDGLRYINKMWGACQEYPGSR